MQLPSHPVVRLRRARLVVPLVLAAVLASLSSGPAGAEPLPLPAGAMHPGRLYSGGQIISMPWVYTTPTRDYLYTSGLGQPYVPVRTFTKLSLGLSGVVDAMPQPPPWVETTGTVTGPIWAPSVLKTGGHYVLWFSAQWRNPHPVNGLQNLQCLGNAVASSPLGPFSNPGQRRPVLCQATHDGAIDPRPTKVGGHWRLYWKSNNNVGPNFTHTTIWTARLSPNGRRLGSAVAIFGSSLAWQQGIVEAPQMVVARRHYYLFYSGNGANAEGAGIGVAICRSATGPCRPLSQGPFLSSDALGNGPSEESLFSQLGATWLLYTPHATYAPGLIPRLAVSRVAFGRHGPYNARFAGAQPGT